MSVNCLSMSVSDLVILCYLAVNCSCFPVNWLSSENFRNPNHHKISKSVAIYTSNLYCSTLLIRIAVFSVPLRFEERERCHLYRSMPPICIAIRLSFVSRYFWENLGGCGHRVVPHVLKINYKHSVLTKNGASMSSFFRGQTIFL